jgi:peroxiredoxin
MKTSRLFGHTALLRIAILCLLSLSAAVPAATPPSNPNPGPSLAPSLAGAAVDLRVNGAFGFPQLRAKVLCDTPELRFSVYNDNDYFIAQAVLWTDGDASLGKTKDGRDIGDNSNLTLEFGKPGEVLANVDRTYCLNPWPRMAGLHYQISIRQGVWTTLKRDSKGRGAIRYVNLPDGKKVRVDTYLLPLEEIGKHPGDSFRFCYWAFSPAPDLTLNSVGFADAGGHYYSYGIPKSLYHEFVLEQGGKIDSSQVPEDRGANLAAGAPFAPKPEAGTGAPVDFKFKAVNGREVDLANYRGKVVLVDFWATWCGPCMVEVPHVVETYHKLHSKGFEIVGISFDQDKAALARVTAQKGMLWPQYFDGKGWQNDFGVKYGIHSIPTMWLIDKQGRIASTDARPDLAGQVERLLNAPAIASVLKQSPVSPPAQTTPTAPSARGPPPPPPHNPPQRRPPPQEKK